MGVVLKMRGQLTNLDKRHEQHIAHGARTLPHGPIDGEIPLTRFYLVYFQEYFHEQVDIALIHRP